MTRAKFSNPEDRFAYSIKRNEKTGCLEWTACTQRNGYGQIRVDGKDIRAHRYAWMRGHGPIPKGMLVLHKCDNPSCVEIDHLFLGTPADNAQDRTSKGRSRSGDLTDDQVRAIRADTRVQRVIASEYGCPRSGISKIKLFQTYAHVKAHETAKT